METQTNLVMSLRQITSLLHAYGFSSTGSDVTPVDMQQKEDRAKERISLVKRLKAEKDKESSLQVLIDFKESLTLPILTRGGMAHEDALSEIKSMYEDRLTLQKQVLYARGELKDSDTEDDRDKDNAANVKVFYTALRLLEPQLALVLNGKILGSSLDSEANEVSVQEIILRIRSTIKARTACTTSQSIILIHTALMTIQPLFNITPMFEENFVAAGLVLQTLRDLFAETDQQTFLPLSLMLKLMVECVPTTVNSSNLQNKYEQLASTSTTFDDFITAGRVYAAQSAKIARETIDRDQSTSTLKTGFGAVSLPHTSPPTSFLNQDILALGLAAFDANSRAPCLLHKGCVLPHKHDTTCFKSHLLSACHQFAGAYDTAVRLKHIKDHKRFKNANDAARGSQGIRWKVHDDIILKLPL